MANVFFTRIFIVYSLLPSCEEFLITNVYFSLSNYFHAENAIFMKKTIFV